MVGAATAAIDLAVDRGHGCELHSGSANFSFQHICVVKQHLGGRVQLPILLEVVRLVCVARNDVRTPILKRLRSHRTANAKLLGLAGKLPRRWRNARRRCAGGSAVEPILTCCAEFSLTRFYCTRPGIPFALRIPHAQLVIALSCSFTLHPRIALTPTPII